MSIVAIGLNLLLSGLLLVALLMGFRLNHRLNALRQSNEGFARAVADLDSAALRAERGLAALREATDEAVDLLSDRIEKARALAAKLERQVERTPEPRPRGEVVPMPRRAPTEERDQPVSESDVERVAHRLGSLLSAARDARQRPAPVPTPVSEAKTTAKSSRQRPGYEDELFGEHDDSEDLILRKSVVGRR